MTEAAPIRIGYERSRDGATGTDEMVGVVNTQRVRDPLHNLIEFNVADEFEQLLWRIVQTRSFQRLRRVKQLGFSDFVYPGASHTRLAHSIGVFHTARRLMEVIRRHTTSPSETKMHQAIAAALVHDLGHGPFSHAFEDVGRRLKLKNAHHEPVSDMLIRDGEVSSLLKELGSGFANDVADIVRGIGNNNMYRAVVSSQFDADRLDYMQRDRMMAGSHHAGIDFEWLIANLEVGQVGHGVDQSPVGSVETFVLGPKAIHGAEAFVLGLFQLYPTIYLHKATRGAEKIFGELLVKIITLSASGEESKTGLSSNHPLIKFGKEPDNIDRFTDLDDGVIWGALPLMADALDPVIAEFSTRLRHRNLFKCIDVRAQISAKYAQSAEGEAQIDKSCAIIEKKLDSWKNSVKHPEAVLLDSASRSPYKKVDETKGPLGRINIRSEGGDLVDISTRSEVVAAIKPFKLFRAYVRRDDEQSAELVNDMIREELTQ